MNPAGKFNYKQTYQKKKKKRFWQHLLKIKLEVKESWKLLGYYGEFYMLCYIYVTADISEK